MRGRRRALSRRCTSTDSERLSGVGSASVASPWKTGGRLLHGVLQHEVVACEVAPDGDIVLEWIGGRKDVLSLNVGPDGEIHFAMRGPDTRLTGKEVYTGSFSPALAEALTAVGSLPHN